MQATQLFTAGAAITRKKDNGKWIWLLVKSEEDKWELPKTTVRKGESSVRAVIRMITEQAGMNARIIEEAGDYQSTTMVNGKEQPKRLIYYVMYNKAGGEIIGFTDPKWFELNDAIEKLESKKEQESLKLAREHMKAWEERKKKKTLATPEV